MNPPTVKRTGRCTHVAAGACPANDVNLTLRPRGGKPWTLRFFICEECQAANVAGGGMVPTRGEFADELRAAIDRHDPYKPPPVQILHAVPVLEAGGHTEIDGEVAETDRDVREQQYRMAELRRSEERLRAAARLFELADDFERLVGLANAAIDYGERWNEEDPNHPSIPRPPSSPVGAEA